MIDGAGCMEDNQKMVCPGRLGHDGHCDHHHGHLSAYPEERS